MGLYHELRSLVNAFLNHHIVKKTQPLHGKLTSHPS